MNDKTLKIVLFCALAIAVWWGYSNYPWKRQDEFKSNALQTKGQTDPPATPITQKGRERASADIAGIQFVENKKWGADPFYSPTPTTRSSARRRAPQTVTYKLRAVIYNTADQAAYINGKIVRVGEIVDGATVMKINRRSVVLKTPAGEKRITVKS